MKQLVVLVCAIAVCFVFAVDANAHSEFKKALQKKYNLKSVSCNTCHVKGKPKSERSDFGKLFDKHFKGKDISAKYKKLKDEELDDEIDEFKKYMDKEFKKAIVEIEKVEKDGSTIGKMIKEGKIDGIKLKE